MKKQLSIRTPSAGTVLIIPDYLDVEGSMALQYIDETTLAERDAAARYLADEGFTEYAKGKLELE